MRAQDIMTNSVMTISPATPVMEIASLLAIHRVNALPVVDESNTVLGLVRRQDLFSQDYQLYFPTYIKLLQEVGFAGGDKKTLPYVSEQILRMTARNVMTKEVFFIRPDTTVPELISTFLMTGAESLPVTNTMNVLLGIVTRGDLLKVMPAAHIGQDYPNTAIQHTSRAIDSEVSYAYKDLRSHFAYVAKMRINTWLAIAIVLFAAGFVAGIVYFANVQPL